MNRACVIYFVCGKVQRKLTELFEQLWNRRFETAAYCCSKYPFLSSAELERLIALRTKKAAFDARDPEVGSTPEEAAEHAELGRLQQKGDALFFRVAGDGSELRELSVRSQ